jgi:VIT1/CCC1 family predicted Fe2+/Mn2+ transporter
MNQKNKHRKHAEQHLIARSGWLRAAVLGANDGILSIASIVSGMAAGGAEHGTIMLAGLAGLMAGATSMATGEYVSVSSQADIEHADLAKEKHELAANPKFEHEELAQIYISRGLEPELAKKVSRQLMAHDALGAHARDELGISDVMTGKPLQAAFSSAASFTLGAALPLITVAVSPVGMIGWTVFIVSLLTLAILGILAAKTSGSKVLRPTLRVVLWGAFSMGITAFIGRLTGTSI